MKAPRCQKTSRPLYSLLGVWHTGNPFSERTADIPFLFPFGCLEPGARLYARYLAELFLFPFGCLHEEVGQELRCCIQFLFPFGCLLSTWTTLTPVDGCSAISIPFWVFVIWFNNPILPMAIAYQLFLFPFGCLPRRPLALRICRRLSGLSIPFWVFAPPDG